MAHLNRQQDFKDRFSTNAWSKFTEWSIELSNGATLTGIKYIPSSKTPGGGPLLLGIHGGTCSAYNYDLSAEYTASTYSDLAGVPFIAFNRPNFLASSGWLVDRSSDNPTQPQFKSDEGRTYFQEEAKWYDEFVFPAIWKEFAAPNGCTSIVTTSHSMAVPITIIASTLYSGQESQQEESYRWSGMVLSGLAVNNTEIFKETAGKMGTNEYDESQLPFGQDSTIHTPPFYEKDKVALMLGPPGLCEDSLGPLIWKQNTPLTIGEVVDLHSTWPQVRQQYQAAVKIPILYGLGEYDWIWQGNEENVEAFCKEFVASPRVESAVVEGAPHAIEPSKVGSGWWLRVFGWAIEVDAGLQMSGSKPPLYD